MNYLKRQRRLLEILDSKSQHAFLIKKKQNISYLVGCKGDDAVLFISRKGNFLITDSRYKEEYKENIVNASLEIVKSGSSLNDIVYAVANSTKSKKVCFESDNFSYKDYLSLKKTLKHIKLVALDGIVESLRVIKDKEEIGYIKDACRYGCKIMDYALRIVEPSKSELFTKNRIEKFILDNGLSKADFDIIVASGRNASKPHASVSSKIIRKGEMVVIDLGAKNYGYNSDLTRTIFLGRIDRKFYKLYNIVQDAQRFAIDRVKAGIKASYIDNISRNYIAGKGMRKYFLHSLGHGVGLETHERPRISTTSKDILAKDMVITIEPGIYIPKWGGVRIEDVVQVKEDGCEILTERCVRGHGDRN